MDNFSGAYMCYGLKVLMTKVLLQTRLAYQSPPGAKITILDYRIKIAQTEYGKLFKRVFSNTEQTQTTKLMVYRATVISTLLYAWETWCLSWIDKPSLEGFHQMKIHQFLRNTWQDRITNKDVLHAKMENRETIRSLHQHRWTRHFSGMQDIHLLKKISHSSVCI